MKTELWLDALDIKTLSELGGTLSGHLEIAFHAFYAHRTGTCAPRPPWSLEFNRQPARGSGIREVSADIPEAACMALRAVGGSFKEQAFDAVKYYFANYGRLGKLFDKEERV
ncbi:MAG: hypothetical protein WBG50_02205 [Desulfomonilaceae bacterium]